MLGVYFALNSIKTNKPPSVFVRKRLTKIKGDKNVEFCFMHTKENPANLPSRTLSTNNLKGKSLWWKGPE